MQQSQSTAGFPPPLVHDHLVRHWVVAARSDVEVWLWGFDLVPHSVEPIGTLTSFPGDGDQDG